MDPINATSHAEESATFDRSVLDYIHRASATGLYEIRGLGAKRRLPTFDDLVLLDADMPGMSGFDLCRLFKGDPALMDVPVIFTTAHPSVAFQVSAFDCGAADFVAKPVSPDLLRARVRAHLQDGASRRDRSPDAID